MQFVRAFLSRFLSHFGKASMAPKPDLSDAQRHEAHWHHTLATYERALTHGANSRALWHGKGSVLYNLKRYEEALAAFDQALNLDPTSAVTWAQKGAALSELERWDEALVAYERALALDSTSARPWTGKGWALNALHRHEEALLALQQALTRGPNFLPGPGTTPASSCATWGATLRP